jgi:hypothetical protein
MSLYCAMPNKSTCSALFFTYWGRDGGKEPFVKGVIFKFTAHTKAVEFWTVLRILSHVPSQVSQLEFLAVVSLSLSLSACHPPYFLPASIVTCWSSHSLIPLGMTVTLFTKKIPQTYSYSRKLIHSQVKTFFRSYNKLLKLRIKIRL